MPTDVDFLAQTPYRCRLRWGRAGLARAAADGDVAVVVDVLSFSTAAVAAIDRGGRIYPCTLADPQQRLAVEHGAEIAVRRSQVPTGGRFSLSPVTLDALEPGGRVIVPSPNGATLCRLGSRVPFLLVGGLVNATAVGRLAAALAEAQGLAVTVVAAGERYKQPTEDGPLRVALEDQLGAGAVVVATGLEPSPEAELAALAFEALRPRLAAVIRDCESGRELTGKGYPQDPARAAELDRSSGVPVLLDGWLVPAEPAVLAILEGRWKARKAAGSPRGFEPRAILLPHEFDGT